MSVAAIIPTVGRADLRRAVASVVMQTVPCTPVVVNDRPEARARVRSVLQGLAYEYVETEGGTGGAAARNAGVAATDADVVAFLDDDDAWAPTKTARQLDALQEWGPDTVLTCLTRFHTDAGRRIIPERVLPEGESVATYLLDRSTVTLRRHFLQSSSLLAPRDVLERVPWDSALRRHQDWDLLIRLDAAGVAIRTVPAVLVDVYQGSAGSISNAGDWRASLEWCRERGSVASRRAQGDFVASIVLRSALRARDGLGVAHALKEIVRLRPHPAALVVGMSGVVR